MNRFYFTAIICALVLGAFFYGTNLADTKCQMRHIKENSQQQTQLIKNERIIHDTVYKTGVADIRNILRDKYSIAE